VSAPRVSVVIPAYNAAAFIEATLETVASQTFKDYEVVVIDDGSSDETKSVVDGWLSRRGIPGRCVKQANKRIAGARNAGLREAKAALIALLDHDDFWAPEKLARCIDAISANPDAVLVGHDIEVVREGKSLGVLKKGPSDSRMYERLLLDGNAVSPSAAVFRRDKALEIGGFREEPQFNTVEDYDFWMRLSKTGPFVFIPAPLARYTSADGGASRKVEYHNSNLEALLKDHFASHFGAAPSLRDRWRMRRRLSFVYRAAAGQLLAAGQEPELQRSYVARMLSTFPFDPRNLGRALQWVVGWRPPRL
jgi:teichuronic acid biosynthesis glycosyltransferase TuaG